MGIFIDRGVRYEDPDFVIKEEDKGKDEMIMFEPLEGVREIPNDALPEWEFNAVKTCVLPGMKEEKDDAAEANTHITGMYGLPEGVDGQFMVLRYAARTISIWILWYELVVIMDFLFFSVQHSCEEQGLYTMLATYQWTSFAIYAGGHH